MNLQYLLLACQFLFSFFVCIFILTLSCFLFVFVPSFSKVENIWYAFLIFSIKNKTRCFFMKKDSYRFFSIHFYPCCQRLFFFVSFFFIFRNYGPKA
ncbi:predicted protein [Enterococcus faecium 1,141,733]|nr:predicted protein [Enterococcus faecium 1,141,733]